MKIYQDKEKLEQAYKELKSAKAIAAKYGHNEKTILSWLHKHNIPVTPKGYGARKYHLNIDYFKNIDSERKAYWLGFIYADGCIFHGSSKNSYRLQINQKASSEPFLHLFLNDIESNYPIYHKTVECCGKKYNTIALHIDCDEMARTLISHSIVPRKTYCNTFPIVADNLLVHFIRGYFDGDGCISCKKNRKFSWRYEFVCKKDFAIYVQSIFSKMGICSYIYPSQSDEVFNLTVLEQYEIYKIGKWMYKEATIFLSEKHDKFLEAMSCIAEMQCMH